MDGWYVGVNGQQRGPLSLDEAVAAVRSAGAAQTYVWREDFAEWKLAADVPEIAGRLRAAPVGPPTPHRTAARSAEPAGLSAGGEGQGGKGYSFTEAVASGFRNYATFSGRAPRSEFWFWVLCVVLASIVTSVIDGVFGLMTPVGGIITLILSLGTFLPYLAIGVRRLHDIDRTGWWLLLPYVVLATSIFLFLIDSTEALLLWSGLAGLALGILFLVWFCTRGTAGPNRFGEDPLGG